MGHWFHHQKVVKDYEEKISDLKKQVAPQPIGACAILLNSQNQVLMGKRKNSYKAGFYGLPGGRIEVNERIEQAIQREVEEETGLKLSSLEYLGVVRENQGDYDFIHFIFVAKNVSQEPTLCEPEKCEGWEWVDLKNLPKQLLPGHKAALELFTSQQKVIDITQ